MTPCIRLERFALTLDFDDPLKEFSMKKRPRSRPLELVKTTLKKLTIRSGVRAGGTLRCGQTLACTGG
jgi:hypothetical protein